MSIYKNIGFVLVPIIFFVLLSLPINIVSSEADKVIAVAAWMVIWWITEAVSIFTTALLPLVLFPLLGIMNLKEVCPNYAHPILYLFFGGFVIALALEKVQLHKRFALNILRLTGTKANGVVFGFMLASVLMSMWISNTATSIIMLPIAISVIDLMIKEEKKYINDDENKILKQYRAKQYHNFALSIMLGIAYCANVGGVATIIGTPPNLFMAGYLQYNNISIDMWQWMKLGVPFSLVMLGIIYFLSVYLFYPNWLGELKLSGIIVHSQLKKLGKMSKEEKIVMIIFLITVFLWIFQKQIKVWFPALGNTTIIAMLGAFTMLVVPSNLKKREFVMKWDDMKRFPWGIIIMFGGGIALAAAFSKVGLIDMIASFVSSQDWGLSVVTVFFAVFALFATELMSNIALLTIALPLIGGIAVGLEVPLLYVVIPVTIACSCAFTLPISTPPNAVVYSSGHIKIHEMARIGIFLNIITILILIVIAEFVVPVIF